MKNQAAKVFTFNAVRDTGEKIFAVRVRKENVKGDCADNDTQCLTNRITAALFEGAHQSMGRMNINKYNFLPRIAQERHLKKPLPMHF